MRSGFDKALIVFVNLAPMKNVREGVDCICVYIFLGIFFSTVVHRNCKSGET